MSALQDRIRNSLKDTEGKPANTIAAELQADVSAIMRSLAAMPDAYIDRWYRSPSKVRSREVAIWMVVSVPENCPRPEKQDAGI